MANKTQRELAFLLTGKDVSATKAMRGVKGEMQSLEKIAGKAGTNMARNLERGLLLGGTAAAGAIGYAIKTAQSFESATAGVAKTVDGDISMIVAGLDKMSSTSPVAYEELAAIAEAAGALGVAKGDILGFTDTVSKLSVTTDLTSEAAATSLGHLKTNLLLTGDEFAHVGNTLVDLGNKGASTESQILGMAEGVSGVAAIVGLSTPQVLGWGAAWANTGEEVEAGSTELQKLFLETFSMVNKGGADLELLAKVAGTSASTFADAYRKDASGAVSQFLVQLGKLSEAEQAATLEKLGFTDIRITRGLFKVLANTDNLTNSLDIANTAWGENNAMQIEAEKRFKTSTSQMQILENNVRLAAATIGSELLPVVNELAQEGVDWIQTHQPEIKAFAKDLAAGIRDAVDYAKSLDWGAIADGLKAGASAAKTIVDVFMGLPDPIKQLLLTGFVVNKFTGGAVQDLLKFSLKSMAVQAGIVNVNGGVVRGGGGVPGVPTGGGLSTLSKVFLVGEAIGLVLAVNAVNDSITAQISAQAADIHQTEREFAKEATVSELQAGLDATNAGIEKLSHDPVALALNLAGMNDAMTHLQAMAQELHDAIAVRTGTVVSPDREHQTAEDTKRAVDDLGIYERQGAREQLAATNRVIAAEERTRFAIQSLTLKPPTVSVLVGGTVVNVSGQSVTTAQKTVSTWTGSTSYAGGTAV